MELQADVGLYSGVAPDGCFMHLNGTKPSFLLSAPPELFPLMTSRNICM